MKKLFTYGAVALMGFACLANPVNAQSNYVPLSSMLQIDGEVAPSENYPPHPEIKTNESCPVNNTVAQPSVPYFYGAESTPSTIQVGARQNHRQRNGPLATCGCDGGCAAAPAPVAAPAKLRCADAPRNDYSKAMSAPWSGQQTTSMGCAPAPHHCSLFGSPRKAKGCAAGCGVSPRPVHPHTGHGHVLLPNNGAQWFGGVNALYFLRDDADEIVLTNSAPGVRALTTRGTDGDEFYGGEAIIGRHLNNGISVAGSYWGLYADNEQLTYAGTPFVALPTLDRLNYDSGVAPVNTVEYFMNSPRAQAHRVSLANEFHNFELNFLRRSLVHGPRRDRHIDIFAGGRYLKINETFQFASAYNPAAFGADPRDMFYNIKTENNLYGIQIGGAGDLAVSKRLTLKASSKVGGYGNAINSVQRIYGSNGNATVNTGAFAGQDYNVNASKNDVALIGEIDLGARYAINQCLNFNMGVRAVGINGLALTTDQIARDFADLQSAGQINSNGSMILYGVYGGITYNF